MRDEQMRCEKMFKKKAFKNEALKIHTTVSLAVSAHSKNQEAWSHRKTGDQLWLAKQSIKETFKVLDRMDMLLERGTFYEYLEQHAILWVLLKELELIDLVRDKIAKKFGEKCFFIAFEIEYVVS